jgi:hypothetical protein
MTNPFEALDISDDEDTFQQTTEAKVKRTHQEKRIYKQQQQEAAKVVVSQVPANTEPFHERVKENAK